MSKPWDCLRQKPVRAPLNCGTWFAAPIDEAVLVHVRALSILPRNAAGARLEISGGYFSTLGLRELAEFCTELADQLEGK